MYGFLVVCFAVLRNILSEPRLGFNFVSKIGPYSFLLPVQFAPFSWIPAAAGKLWFPDSIVPGL